MPTRDDTINFLKLKRQTLVDNIASLEKDLEHLNATIRLLEKDHQSTPNITVEYLSPEESFPEAKLKGMTQVQALMVIAKHFGGTIKAQDVKKIMIRAGVMKETKNSTNIAHNLILRTGKFERVAPGEYRLKQESSDVNGGFSFQNHVQ